MTFPAIPEEPVQGTGKPLRPFSRAEYSACNAFFMDFLSIELPNFPPRIPEASELEISLENWPFEADVSRLFVELHPARPTRTAAKAADRNKKFSFFAFTNTAPAN
ncbi:MAG: hypothetical protein JKY82_01075 [Rhizobiaceae bacterium]|nr:hypothetical protein [Rhizobiaceae bacterium]